MWWTCQSLQTWRILWLVHHAAKSTIYQAASPWWHTQWKIWHKFSSWMCVVKMTEYSVSSNAPYLSQKRSIMKFLAIWTCALLASIPNICQFCCILRACCFHPINTGAITLKWGIFQAWWKPILSLWHVIKTNKEKIYTQTIATGRERMSKGGMTGLCVVWCYCKVSHSPLPVRIHWSWHSVFSMFHVSHMK